MAMMKKQTAILVFLCCILLAVIFFGGKASFSSVASEPLSISFLDVGQGDSIFIETPTGNQILIDGGPDDAVLAELGRMMPIGDRSIDMVIATHPDADHIAGLVSVLQRYDVEAFVDPGVEANTAVYRELMQTVESRVPRYITTSIGDRIVSDDGAVLDVLAPYRISDDDTNSNSVVTRLSYGNLSVMLTGDTTSEIEQQLTRWYGNQLESEILKAGHHGSKTSTDREFVKAVHPIAGIISAGKNNRYGHPAPVVLEILEQAQMQIIGTYDEGTITFYSDGVGIWR